uniref:Uncharacterized protein n=1 Tax=Chromera velia CCMP2878 TaxID=1169474 RepID=A0A0G4F557_9ALVE|eukprot:Cvel_2728.t1-p1 / transcript=Cvel_2728.t1 / gene=Cvel_2728 / organism=Chromera_velia_CCMP2878 / gene_product=hypothetical protein / transcript_product=hypothetical protein / location=Cvel_scaffold109:44384-48833(-) / protein_length=437 / sequence_SO=supercontig / SO=protein_coding / is_pseudo=false
MQEEYESAEGPGGLGRVDPHAQDQEHEHENEEEEEEEGYYFVSPCDPETGWDEKEKTVFFNALREIPSDTWNLVDRCMMLKRHLPNRSIRDIAVRLRHLLQTEMKVFQAQKALAASADSLKALEELDSRFVSEEALVPLLRAEQLLHYLDSRIERSRLEGNEVIMKHFLLHLIELKALLNQMPHAQEIPDLPLLNLMFIPEHQREELKEHQRLVQQQQQQIQQTHTHGVHTHPHQHPQHHSPPVSPPPPPPPSPPPSPFPPIARGTGGGAPDPGGFVQRRPGPLPPSPSPPQDASTGVARLAPSPPRSTAEAAPPVSVSSTAAAAARGPPGPGPLDVRPVLPPCSSLPSPAGSSLASSSVPKAAAPPPPTASESAAVGPKRGKEGEPTAPPPLPELPAPSSPGGGTFAPRPSSAHSPPFGTASGPSGTAPAQKEKRH